MQQKQAGTLLLASSAALVQMVKQKKPKEELQLETVFDAHKKASHPSRNVSFKTSRRKICQIVLRDEEPYAGNPHVRFGEGRGE